MGTIKREEQITIVTKMKSRLIGKLSQLLRDTIRANHEMSFDARATEHVTTLSSLCSNVYCMGSKVHAWLYRQGPFRFRSKSLSTILRSSNKTVCFAAPTISVGNFAAGGTGKTPMVQHIVQLLESVGCKPMVVCRGYGGDEEHQMRYRFAKHEKPTRASGTMVVCGSNRFDAVVDHLSTVKGDFKTAPNVFVLDDGLQHWSLERDLDVVMVNAYDPWGLKTIVREKPEHSLPRADVIVLHNCTPGRFTREYLKSVKQKITAFACEQMKEQKASTLEALPSVPIVGTYSSPCAVYSSENLHLNKKNVASADTLDLHSVDDFMTMFQGHTVVAISGIGCPISFANMLKHQLGASKVDTKFSTFPDHHMFTKADVETVWTRVQYLSASTVTGKVLVATTEKDFFRCIHSDADSEFIDTLRPFVISVDIKFCNDQEEFDFKRKIITKVAPQTSASFSSSVSSTSRSKATRSAQCSSAHLSNSPVSSLLSGAVNDQYSLGSNAAPSRMRKQHGNKGDMREFHNTATALEFPFHHIPVLPREVALNWIPPARFTKDSSEPCLMIDATAGGGGHSKVLLDATANNPNIRLLCIDRDAEALDTCKRRLEFAGDRVFYAHGKFSELQLMLKRPDILDFLKSGSKPFMEVSSDNDFQGNIGGVIADLGVSTYQLENAERGFSCMPERTGPLDMRMSTVTRGTGGDQRRKHSSHDREVAVSAADLVNNLSEDQLTWIFREYGGVSYKEASRAARNIFDARPITYTSQLANALIPSGSDNRTNQKRRGGQMQRYFQALRIATNNEIEELESLLSIVPKILTHGGVFVVISFHSLEDVRVKNMFRHLDKKSRNKNRKNRKQKLENKPAFTEDAFTLITRRAIKASPQEIEKNKPSRSARLRVLKKGTI